MVSFSEMFKGAAAAGAEHAQQRQEVTAERVQSLKDKIREGWESVKGGAKATKEAVVTGGHIVEGLVATSEGRGLFGQFCREKIQAGKDAITDRCEAVADGFREKRDAVVNKLSETAQNIAQGAREHVINPLVDGGKKVGHAVVQGAKDGALFTVGLGVMAAKGVYEGGKFVVDKTVSEAEAVSGKAKEVAQAATERAHEWNGRFQGFLKNQRERLSDGVKHSAAEIHALYHEVTALPDRVGVSFAERSAQRHETKEAKHARIKAEAKARADEKRSRIDSKKLKAQEWRSASTGLRAESAVALATLETRE